MRDFVVFFGLTVFPVAHFLLQDFPNTDFYIILLILSLIGIVLLKHYHEDWEFPFDFDENLTLRKWAWVIIGVLGIYCVSAFFASVSTPAGQFDPTIFVPTVVFLPLSFTYQFPTYVNDMLFNIALVAPAEEFCKLVCIIALCLFLGKYIKDKKTKIGISVSIPVFFWAVLHVYKNPVYIGNYWFVASAFCSGLILIVVLWKTESILAAILSHGFYNSLVAFLVAQAILVVSSI